MGLFDIFKKKQKPEVIAEINDGDNSCSVKEDGSVEMQLNIAGHDMSFNTSVDFLERFSNRKDDPNSCRREPTSDEVKLSTNENSELFFKQFGWEKQREYFNLRERESLAGFNYFVMPKVDYDEAVRLYDKMKEEARKRDFVLSETARLNSVGISLESDNKIDEAIEIYESNIKLGYPARHSYDRLIVLYHKRNDRANEERLLRLAIDKFPNETNYKKKLDKLTGQYNEILPTTVLPHVEIDETLGKRYFAEILKLREFDFYAEKPDDMDTMSYLSLHKEIASNAELSTMNEIRAQLISMLDEAASYEDVGRFDLASDIYEKMIANDCYQTKPYERLMIIYHKAKMYEEEKRVIIKGIKFFEQLKERQKEYVLELASKYGKLEFAKDYIDNGKRIQYYYGVFDLYNPYNITEKWKTRLSKMK